jgi:hypothetical protein
MANKYALVKNGVVVNMIVADPSFLPLISDQYDNALDYTGQDIQIDIGFTFDSGNNSFSPPELNVQQQQQILLDQINQRIKHGKDVISHFRLYTLSIPDDQAASLIVAFGDVVQLLNLGILIEAAALLNSITGVDILDQPYDPNFPGGDTVRQYFARYIAAGDPL